MSVIICPFIILLEEMKSIFFHSLEELTFVPTQGSVKLFLPKKSESFCLTVKDSFEGDSTR